jgi:hypothetical protein
MATAPQDCHHLTCNRGDERRRRPTRRAAIAVDGEVSPLRGSEGRADHRAVRVGVRIVGFARHVATAAIGQRQGATAHRASGDHGVLQPAGASHIPPALGRKPNVTSSPCVQPPTRAAATSIGPGARVPAILTSIRRNSGGSMIPFSQCNGSLVATLRERHRTSKRRDTRPGTPAPHGHQRPTQAGRIPGVDRLTRNPRSVSGRRGSVGASPRTGVNQWHPAGDHSRARWPSSSAALPSRQ